MTKRSRLISLFYLRKQRVSSTLFLCVIGLVGLLGMTSVAAISTKHTQRTAKTSIFSFIKNNIDAQSGELKDSALELPDEQFRLSHVGVRWAAGALDSMSETADAQRMGKHIDNILAILAEISVSNTEQAKAELYGILMNDTVIGYIDAITQALSRQKIKPDPYLHKYLNFLVRKSPDRGPIKFSLAVLGEMGDVEDLPLIHTMGLHEEFTLYSAVAISKLLPKADVALWELAKKVSGWGRIQTVERLANTRVPEIKRWILYQGYRNSVSYEYLAAIAATTGDLNFALAKRSIDRELLISSGEIIDAMITAGPKLNLDTYSHAGEVIENYLRHVVKHKKDVELDSLLVVHAIQTYVRERKLQNQLKKDQAWYPKTIQITLDQTQKILAWDLWEKQTKNALNSSSNLDFYQANRAAKILGIDTWSAHWKRLNENPMDSGRWNEVMQLADETNIATIIDLAKKKLPLQKISTGPGREIGLGPEYSLHSCLDLILQDLERFPLQGWALINTGLHSPVIRNRAMAVRALQSWDKNKWSKKVHDSLLEVYNNEPEQDIKQSLMALLNKP